VPQPHPEEHAAALQHILSSLGVLTVSQLVDLFNSYSDVPGFTGILHTAVPEIVGQHAQAAATVAAQWYDELNPQSTFQASAVTDLAPERVKKSIDWAIHAPGEAKPLDRLAGSAKRMVYDAARDTITENSAKENIGWARYAQPDACAFCRVLATRSGDNLYMSEHSAQFVVGKRGIARGSRKLGEKYHDHCRCVPFPIREGDYEPPDYTQQWQQQYQDARDDVGGNLKAILAHMRANTDAH
jgi:hypothetical protein